jgi:hypothetical protein
VEATLEGRGTVMFMLPEQTGRVRSVSFFLNEFRGEYAGPRSATTMVFGSSSRGKAGSVRVSPSAIHLDIGANQYAGSACPSACEISMVVTGVEPSAFYRSINAQKTGTATGRNNSETVRLRVKNPETAAGMQLKNGFFKAFPLPPALATADSVPVLLGVLLAALLTVAMKVGVIGAVYRRARRWLREWSKKGPPKGATSATDEAKTDSATDQGTDTTSSPKGT